MVGRATAVAKVEGTTVYCPRRDTGAVTITLRKSFIIYRGHIIDTQPSTPTSCKEILATELDLEHIFPMVMMRDLELLVLGFVFLILVRIGELVEVTANHRLRFILFRHRHRLQSAVAFSHPGKPPNKAHKIAALPQDGLEPAIVIILG